MNLEILNSCCHCWFFLYKVGSLDESDAELANYGPENFSSRITVKMKEGQETAFEKHNIHCFIFVMIPLIRFIHFRAFTSVL